MRTIPSLAAFAFVVFGLSLAFIPEVPSALASVTTITGWNVPSGTTFGNGIVALMLPLATMAIFAGLPMLFEQRGDIIVTLALIGLEIGCLVGMLSLTSSNATNIPLALAIVGGLFLGLWLWRSN